MSKLFEGTYITKKIFYCYKCEKELEYPDYSSRKCEYVCPHCGYKGIIRAANTKVKVVKEYENNN